jgi:hypothetical protein
MYLCANIRLIREKRTGVVLEQWIQAEDPSLQDDRPSRVVPLGDGTALDPNAYAIERLPVTFHGTEPSVRFSHICSPSEMYELSSDPDAGGSYFRTSSIEMIFDHARQAQKTLAVCEADLKALYEDLQILSRYN